MSLLSILSLLASASWDLQDLQVTGCARFSDSNQDPAFKSDESVCVVSKTMTDYTQYLARECVSPYFCDQTSLTDGLAYCMPVTTVDPTNLYNGIKCNYNDDCRSNICSSGVCKRGAGLDCQSTADCDGGYYCSSNVCTPLILENGTGCQTDDQCAFGLGCRKMKALTTSTNTCIKYFSLSDGESLLPNGDGVATYICKSGWAYLDTESNTGMCVEAPKTDGYPKKCSTDSDCTVTYDTGLSYTTRCDCGYNNEGQRYCALNIGDGPYQDFLDKLKDWSEHTDGAQCNALKMNDDECVKSWWGSDDADEFAYYKARASLYHKLEGADSLIRKIFERQYEELYQAYDDDDFAVGLLGALGIFYLV